MIKKTIQEINQKIKEGNATVVTAIEMVNIVADLGKEGAAKEVDVVTTGTFGAMCSSGAWLNLGHSDPPIKMQKVFLNEVEAYTGVAAIDAYIGATQLSESHGMDYGGAHVIEDLIRGKSIDIRATAYGTDCYPKKELETTITIDDLNQAIMLNSRNCYQKYNAATNSSNRKLHTYMGALLPDYGNVTYSGAGVLSPLSNDPEYQTIGMGTRIFLGGGEGYVIGEGTQHDPIHNFGTLMLRGDLKEMNPDFVKAVSFKGYGTTLYLGVGVPIPILNERIAEMTAVKDSDIITNVLDYAVPSRNRPKVRQVSYEELKSGSIDINGKAVSTNSMSGFKKAKRVAEELKNWIDNSKFFLSEPACRLPNSGIFKPMRESKKILYVRDIMSTNIVTISINTTMHQASKIMVDSSYDKIPVISDAGTLAGIVTSWDISKAIAQDKETPIENIMTKKVITTSPNNAIAVVAKILNQSHISALPVINDENKVIGIITSDDISKLLARRY